MDVNPVSIAQYFQNLVSKEFPHYKPEKVTEVEEEFAKELLNKFFAILTDVMCELDEELDESTPTQGSSFSQQLVVDETGKELQPMVSSGVSIERKQEILKLIHLHPNWSVASIQSHGGKEYKHKNYKSKWEAQVKAGGTRYEKFKHIDAVTFQKFQDARKSLLPVRDRHLQLWAISASQSFRDPTFKFAASPTWVIEFKKRFGISSRKVTKLVSKNDAKSTEEILKNASQFQSDIKCLASTFPHRLILNTDQAGFTYELNNGRTLTFKGEKMTLGLSKSPTGLATHSYTVQYIINMAGEIVGDVFVCLQERSGRLGPIVQDNLPIVPNVTFTCSKSGKLTTSLYEYFLDNVVLTSVKEDFVFVLDTWSGQTNVSSYEGRFGINGAPKCQLKLVPKRCTAVCQPLDTTFHRQLKYFCRRLYEQFLLHHSSDINPADELTTRNNILIMHSLLHNQFSAPIFKEMIKYCWFSSGLTDERETFLSVKEACFSFNFEDPVNCQQNCESPRFLKCAHCRKIFCFVCFFNGYHYHF